MTKGKPNTNKRSRKPPVDKNKQQTIETPPEASPELAQEIEEALKTMKPGVLYLDQYRAYDFIRKQYPNGFPTSNNHK